MGERTINQEVKHTLLKSYHHIQIQVPAGR